MLNIGEFFSFRFVWIDDNTFAYKWKIGNRVHFWTGGNSFICRCTIAEKRIHIHIFFSQFFTPRIKSII